MVRTQYDNLMSEGSGHKSEYQNRGCSRCLEKVREQVSPCICPGQKNRHTICTNLGGQTAGDHGEARRSAQRRICVGRVKDNALFHEFGQMGHLSGALFSFSRQDGVAHLIGLQVMY